MSFRIDQGHQVEHMLAARLRSLGHTVTILDEEHGTHFPWGDLHSITPDGRALFLSSKGRMAIEHQTNGTLVLNSCYDGKGRREFEAGLRRLAQLGYRVDAVAAVAVQLHLDHRFDMYVVSLGQMIVTGEKKRWSIPMSPIECTQYVHLACGLHDFDWSRYRDRWFYRPYLHWKRTGESPTVIQRRCKPRRRPPLPQVFPDIMEQPYARCDLREIFGCPNPH